ncbi:MAG: NB-ARC domain-containing protein, partial [Chloroflexi bacterium]|nr:NB-ARC domain-containing protein [Chloroflexota bacterium]
EAPAIIPAAPAPPTHFTGRVQDLHNLKRRVVSNQAPALLALLGMGGLGKTALAKMLAVELAAHFSGGIFWGSLPDHDGNPRPVLRAWGAACADDLPDQTDTAALVNQVRGLLAAQKVRYGPVLVIIDDVRPEWLSGARYLKEAIPAGTPGLLSSRDEELALALDAEPYHLNALADDEALKLLAAHAGNGLIANNRALANELVRLLGNLPLAIELAGKRLALLGRKPGHQLANLAAAVAVRANEALALPGHPGLAATFAITYDALPASQQRLFRWLGSFAPAPLKPATVAGVMELSPAEAEAGLDALVVRALLEWGQPEAGPSPAATYTIHPLLREYAQVELAASGEDRQAWRCHLDYYHNLGKVAVQKQPPAYDQVEAELPNLQQAFRWAQALADDEAVCAMTILARPVAWQRGYLPVWREWLLAAVEAAGRRQDWPALAQMQNWLGAVHGQWGELDQAAGWFEQSRHSFNRAGDLAGEAKTLCNLALVAVARRTLDQAENLLQQAGALAGPAADPALRRLLHTTRARVAYDRGDFTAAAGHYQAALAAVEETGDLYDLAFTRGSLAYALADAGRLDEAEREVRTALTLAEQERLVDVAASSQHNLAYVLSRQGRWDEALELSLASLAEAARLNLTELLAANAGLLASRYAALVAGGELETAQALEQALRRRLPKPDGKPAAVVWQRWNDVLAQARSRG